MEETWNMWDIISILTTTVCIMYFIRSIKNSMMYILQAIILVGDLNSIGVTLDDFESKHGYIILKKQRYIKVKTCVIDKKLAFIRGGDWSFRITDLIKKEEVI